MKKLTANIYFWVLIVIILLLGFYYRPNAMFSLLPIGLLIVCMAHMTTMHHGQHRDKKDRHG